MSVQSARYQYGKAGFDTNPVAARMRSTQEEAMIKATSTTYVFLDIGGF
jgi:hypothetical protein